MSEDNTFTISEEGLERFEKSVERWREQSAKELALLDKHEEAAERRYQEFLDKLDKVERRVDEDTNLLEARLGPWIAICVLGAIGSLAYIVYCVMHDCNHM